MTWQSRDVTKQRQRQTKVAQKSAQGEENLVERELPPWQRQVPSMKPQGDIPAALPTFAHEAFWLGDEDNAGGYTMEEERQLAAEGIWSGKQWDRFAFLCRRGYTEL